MPRSKLRSESDEKVERCDAQHLDNPGVDGPTASEGDDSLTLVLHVTDTNFASFVAAMRELFPVMEKAAVTFCCEQGLSEEAIPIVVQALHADALHKISKSMEVRRAAMEQSVRFTHVIRDPTSASASPGNFSHVDAAERQPATEKQPEERQQVAFSPHAVSNPKAGTPKYRAPSPLRGIVRVH